MERKWHDDKERSKEVTVKGKKAVIISIVLILLILVIAQVSYLYVIPRVTIDLKTVYHEATGGGGSGGLVNLNSKFINSGTVDVNDFKMKVAIFDSNKVLLKNETFEQSLVSPGDSHEIKLITNGNCYETFYIELEIEFNTDNNEYYEKYNYKTHEDAMNIGFEDTIFDWGF